MDFDRDRFPIAQNRTVDLGDRSGGDRRHGEFKKELPQGSAEFLLHQAARNLGGHRSDALEEPVQFFADLLRKNIKTQREKLPEFEIGKAKILKRPAKADRETEPPVPGEGDQVRKRENAKPQTFGGQQGQTALKSSSVSSILVRALTVSS